MTAHGATAAGLHEQLLEAIGADLAAGELSPGMVLPIEALEERYGVSRTVVREAVKVLQQLGIVTSRRRVGISIQPSTQWEALNPYVIRWRLAGPTRVAQLREISELRTGVEPVAASLAARRATSQQCQTLVNAAGGMLVTGHRGDLQPYLEHDIVFHTTLLAASGNAAFASLAPLVAEALSGRTQHDLMPARPLPEAMRWHREVADAIAAGDPRLAEEGMRCIVREAQEATDPELASSHDS
ncbi:FadR/GntR family transcriptional regulator [Gephyromycinifex aptenodytis]|uniref:FadR/GntR family transcriptional regulator n=1 Tax=Gephyromycinifex aptenodytis TaxID=2716227 RepID=UPI001B30017D|nr:FCD domain-containing protein [Gephyromycinifex aptenodytis]